MTLMLILAALLSAPPPPAEPLRVVFISTDEGTFTPAEEVAILARAERALAFWEGRAPAPRFVRVEHGGSFVAVGEIGPWLDGLGEHADLTVYVIYNGRSGVQLPVHSFGMAAAPLRFAAVTSYHPLNAEATLAHELGHLVYGLVDTYPCISTDMMCNPASAYPERLGCLTLEQLGGACWRVGLPMIGRAYGG